MKIVISEEEHTLSLHGKIYTLEEYIHRAKQQYDKKHEVCCCFGDISFEDTDLPLVLSDWYACVGSFTQEELDYLKKEWDLEDYDIEFLLTDPNEEE